MDIDVNEALKAAAVKHPGYRTHTSDNTPDDGFAGVGDFMAALEASERGFSGGGHYLKEFYQQAFGILKPHLVQKAVTDDHGKAQFTFIRPGIYYIMGSAGNTNPQVWNRKVDITKSSQRVILE